MVKVIIIDTGEEIDVLPSGVSYNVQVADIGDVSKVNASYSPSLKYPKTPNNVQIFNGLGLVGSASRTPFIKIRVNVLDNGIAIISNGLLTIRETKDDYRGFIQDGIIDFFKEVSADKISDTIDLSDLTHENTVENIIASFTGDIYRYIVASYNGPLLANVNGVTNLSPVAMIPSISIPYLFDSIMQHYGWTYSGDIDLSNMWMTYPNAANPDVGESEPPIAIGEAVVKTYPQPNANFVGGPRYLYEFENVAIDTDFIYIVDTGHPGVTSFAFAQPGNYRITYNISGDSLVFQAVPFRPELVKVSLYRNGTPILTPVEIFVSLYGEGSDMAVIFDIVAFENEVIQIVSEPVNYPTFLQFVEVTEGAIRIDKLGVQDVDFSEALIKVKVKDFFKEILTRQALIPFPDVYNRNLHFVSVNTRLNAEVIDWTDKFVRRLKETYVYNSYARNNNFTHKYDEGEEDFNDGVLLVDNENLTEEKDLYKSFTHSPLEDFVTFNGNAIPEYQVNNFKMFNAEVSTNPDTGDTIATYKPLKNRFYIFNSADRADTIYILGNPVSGFPVAVMGGNTFKDIVGTEYPAINAILNDTRIHDIELALTKWEVATVDLSKRYYFRQEAAVYILNRLRWKSGSTCVGEFIKLTVENTQVPEDGPDPEEIQSFDASNAVRATHVEACNLDTTLTRYFLGSGAEPEEGDTIYLNADGEQVLNANNFYLKMTGSTLRISAQGIVTTKTPC